MATDDRQINEILGFCLQIDIRAEETYRQFATLAQSKDLAELSEFWNDMADDEKSHIVFWEKVIALAHQGVIPMLFDNPTKTIEELKETCIKVEALMERVAGKPSQGTQFILAYRLEFYLLHPAFETFFHFMESVFAESNPEADYEEHIRRFLQMFEKYGETTPELELLGELLIRLWDRNKSLAKQSHQDQLTELLNRRGFFNSIVPLLHHAQRRQLTLGVLLLDIDNFKLINDRCGHLTGDQVLVEVAHRIKSQVRASDLTARYGGEEFVVFLFDLGQTHLQEIAEKIRLAVAADPISEQTVTISVGATCGPINGNIELEFQTLLNYADACLYEAKSLGKNRTVLKVAEEHEFARRDQNVT
ncbi:diguanylate cyclase [Trichloromonas sp.]|uniref:diguanylate cyclase n=1 Tax=Trichloromonas sp. TaxID=3069249 RepID=UPI003D812CEE